MDPMMKSCMDASTSFEDLSVLMRPHGEYSYTVSISDKFGRGMCVMRWRKLEIMVHVPRITSCDMLLEERSTWKARKPKRDTNEQKMGHFREGEENK